MKTLDTYRNTIEQQPACSTDGFAHALARARQGDDAARRQILGSCLRLALARVEGRSPECGEDELFALIQDANAALEEALANFAGSSLSDFMQHAQHRVDRCLDDLLGQSTQEGA